MKRQPLLIFGLADSGLPPQRQEQLAKNRHFTNYFAGTLAFPSNW